MKLNDRLLTDKRAWTNYDKFDHFFELYKFGIYYIDEKRS